jgi:hypothetical protein
MAAGIWQDLHFFPSMQCRDQIVGARPMPYEGAWSNTIPSGALIPVDPEPSLPSDWDIDLQRSGCDKPVRMPRALKRSIEKSVQEAADGPALADCARLAAMDRYERRALSRRKFAIREFDAARKALA